MHHLVYHTLLAATHDTGWKSKLIDIMMHGQRNIKIAYVGQTSRSLKLHFQEHVRYIWNDNPQSAYAQHILHDQHEYGPMVHSLTIPKALNNTTMLIPYEQFFMQSLHQEGHLNLEQYPGEQNLLLQLAADPSYTPQGGTSQATSLTPNTWSMPPLPGPPTYYNIRYVLSNVINLHTRTHLIHMLFHIMLHYRIMNSHNYEFTTYRTQH
jgi:hypothetical protein